MKINFRTYKKRNGDLMLYINRSNKVSVGVADSGFSPYGKGTTQGHRNAFNAAISVFEKSGEIFTGDLSKHKENGFNAPVNCPPFIIVGTDVATIGGMKMSSDGGYVVYKNKILPQSVWLQE